ncbi:MAG: methionyl-tRNA formyltransferase [Candidatus Binatia bacterium]|jgi:methionyl-tRNA formyltransferase
MTAKLDGGDNARIESAPLESTDTYGTATYKLPALALDAARALLSDFSRDNRFSFTPKAESRAGYQNAPTPKDVLIDWAAQSAEEIAAIARAANPMFMGALFSLRNAPAYLPQATPILDRQGDETPGTVIECSPDTGIVVRCAEKSALRLDIVSTDQGVFSGPRAIDVFGVNQAEFLQIQPL